MLKKLGVNVILNQQVDKDLIENSDCDVVIVATGGKPIIPEISGVGSKNVVTACEILDGKVFCGQKAVVIGGGQIGTETALHLAVHRKDVTLIEMTNDLAIKETAHPREFLLKAVEDSTINVILNGCVKDIREDSVVVEIAKDQLIEVQADTVILAIGMQEENALSKSIVDCKKKIITIGDAKEVRQVMDAVREGFETAMNL